MSDTTPVISPENLPTVAAVGFVLALLSLAVNGVNYMRTNEVAVAVAAFELRDSNEEASARDKSAQQITALEARVAELEAQAKAAATADSAEAAADAAE